jgi:pyruvate-ferredoxin/flavodoxin oxidoreductase
MAYQKVNAIFSSPERKAPGSGGIFSIFVSDLCKGCAACVTACGDHKALKMVQETEEVNAEHETGTGFLDLLPDTSQKYLGLYNGANPGGLKDRHAAQHADGAHQLRRAGFRRRRLRGLRRKERAALHCRRHRGVHAARLPRQERSLCGEGRRTWKDGAAKLAALKEKQRRRVRTAAPGHRHLVMGLGGEDVKDTKARIAAYEASTASSPTRSLLKPLPQCC